MNKISERLCKLIPLLLSLFLLSGCIMQKNDILKVLSINTWIVYLLSLFTIWVIAQQSKPPLKFIKTKQIIIGAIPFIILSLIGLFLIKSSDISIVVNPVSHYVASMVVSGPVALSTVAAYFIFRYLKIGKYFVIPYIVTLFYFISLMVDYYFDTNISSYWLLTLYAQF